MKVNIKRLAISITIPLAVGSVSALLTMNSMEQFEKLNQPPLSPPGWLFPIVWTVLYTLMGIASYLIFESKADHRKIINALTVYGVQLFFNFMWTILFFNIELYYFAFGWIIALLALVIINILMFNRILKSASYLLIPYALWISFAAYLNLGVAMLN